MGFKFMLVDKSVVILLSQSLRNETEDSSILLRILAALLAAVITPSGSLTGLLTECLILTITLTAYLIQQSVALMLQLQ